MIRGKRECLSACVGGVCVCVCKVELDKVEKLIWYSFKDFCKYMKPDFFLKCSRKFVAAIIFVKQCILIPIC